LKTPSARQPPPLSFARRLLDAFSLRRNLVEVWRRPGDAFAPLDGLRAIAVLWVMIFHCFTVPTVQWASAGNMVRFLDEPALSVAFSGHLGVEIFLVLSGFLMAHLLLREVEATGTVRFFTFLRRRAIRILPVYAAAIGVHMLVDPHQREVCTRAGWANLLFVNNFIGEQLSFNACLMHSWSIAVEFQLYLVSPFVVWWMCARRGAAGRPWGLTAPLLLIAIGTVVSSAIVLANYQRPLGEWYLVTFYDKTYCRSTPYFCGVAAAYLFHHRGRPGLPESPQSPRSAWRLPVQVLALGVVAAIAFLGAGEHPSRYIPGAIDLHPWRNLFLLLFARQLFGAAVAVILYESVTGGLRFVERFLSARVWVPLARLSYAAYLVEFLCILPLYAVWRGDFAQARTFSELLPALAADGAACVALTFVVALFFHLLVEKPFVNLR
jgi:peptidoglycan/LPS O-acetylase OafA/YrhL